MRKWLEELVAEKEVSISRIDDAVRRILRVKFELGLFENRYVDAGSEINAPEAHRQLALEAARENIVLLKTKTTFFLLTPANIDVSLLQDPMPTIRLY